MRPDVIEARVDASLHGSSLLRGVDTLGRASDARRQAGRIHEITDSGDHWYGVRAIVRQADGMAAAAGADFDAAEMHFAEAVSIARDYDLIRVELGAT